MRIHFPLLAADGELIHWADIGIQHTQKHQMLNMPAVILTARAQRLDSKSVLTGYAFNKAVFY